MYAGPLVIRKYQESIGKIQGNVCIIPKSAHDMNPDSAVMPHISMKINWIDDFQGVPVEDLRRTRLETEDVEWIEMIAVKSCKSPDYYGWNGLQSLVIETEGDDVWLDDAMRKTTKSEREAKDQITEQVNKHVRARRHLIGLSKIDPSSDSKVV